MFIQSEKAYYRDEFRRISSKYNTSQFLWGEDLLDKKLMVYTGKFKKIPDYDLLSEELMDSRLIIVCPRKEQALKGIPCRFAPLTDSIYISEDDFNRNWKLLKSSVKLGMKMIERSGTECSVHSPDDLVVFVNLMRKSSEPYLENDRIAYKPRKKSEEEMRLERRRQSALDNLDFLYFYSKEGGAFHDRSCIHVKEISDANFRFSAEKPEGRNFCKRCMRTLFLRIACAPNNKEIPACDRFLARYGIGTKLLKELVENGLRFHVRKLNEMIVNGTEDTWKIIATDQNDLELWHNNYVKTSETERYLTEGFHKQGVEGKTLRYMLRYIENYSWEKHLAGEVKLSMEEYLNEEETTTSCEGTDG